jgi:class 3 adenylate cyclase
MPDPAADEKRISDAISLIKRSRAKGDGFASFDLALRALHRHPGSLALAYHAILQAARIGALSQASRLFDLYRVAKRTSDNESDPHVSTEDLLALPARLSKDHALENHGPERSAKLAAAAKDYLAVFTRTGGYYPLINAADLLDLAGDAEGAATHARQTLTLLAALPHDADAAENFWSLLSGLEAHLVLAQLEQAHQAAEAASAAFHGDYGDLSTTIRQLSRLVAEKRLNFAVGQELGMPGVLCYSGHIIAAPGKAGRFLAEQEHDVGAAIGCFLDGRKFGWAYGSLAAGADIMVVEAMLKRGIEVHIVLPFNEAEFVDVSVRPSGARWVGRYNRCRRKVATCRTAIDGGYFGDDTLFASCFAYAMGLGRLQSAQLGAELIQLLVWDGQKQAEAIAGTAADHRLGHSIGVAQHIIAVQPKNGPKHTSQNRPLLSHRRQARAMIFADVVGFSRIHDDDLPQFHKAVLAPMATAIASLPKVPSIVETWGDAVFLVYDDVEEAAAGAMTLLGALERLDRQAMRLPADLGLRVSAHFGSTFDIINPFTLRPGCLGIHVSRAARIEPVTPPGVVYVSEAFAAQLALKLDSQYRADFVGTTKLAKKFGHLPVFRLIADAIRR